MPLNHSSLYSTEKKINIYTIIQCLSVIRIFTDTELIVSLDLFINQYCSNQLLTPAESLPDNQLFFFCKTSTYLSATRSHLLAINFFLSDNQLLTKLLLNYQPQVITSQPSTSSEILTDYEPLIKLLLRY